MMPPQQKRLKRSHPNTSGDPLPDDSNPLPGCAAIADNRFQYSGHFDGHAVHVDHISDMQHLYERGCFGVGSRTKSAPAVLWQLKQQPDLAADIDGETLVLFLEEAFFLHYSLRCLRIRDGSLAVGVESLLSSEAIFAEFCRLKPAFVTHFVAYLWLRSQNWVVKSGLKFGGDFLLYKRGPRYYHASYVVLVRTVDDTSDRVQGLDTHSLQGHYRIAEASKKELLILEVSYPDGLSADSPVVEVLPRITDFTISEMVPKRFNLNQERIVTSKRS